MHAVISHSYLTSDSMGSAVFGINGNCKAVNSTRFCLILF